MARGRPTLYTQELATEICNDICKGITLSEICRREHMPDRQTVYDWLSKDEIFNTRFARARDVGFDAIADECFTIADDNSRDIKEFEITPGVKTKTVDYEIVQRSKLRIETRLKLLAKWDRKRYGDSIKIDAEITSLTPEQRAEKIAAILGKTVQ